MFQFKKNLGKILIKSTITIFAVFFFVMPVFVHAATINTFSSQFAIQRDGAVQVTERIVYDFGTASQHGIYRTIPLTTSNGPQITISNITVTNENGVAYSFSTSLVGNVENIRIGDPNVMVTGQKTYVIGYTVGNVIRNFTDHEEFYWNVTGNGWQVPLSHVEATVILPDSAIRNVQVRCLTGIAGSSETACTANEIGGVAQFATTRSLAGGEGFSIVVGMPLGSVTAATVSASVPPSVYSPQGYADIPIQSNSFISIFSIIPIIFSIFFMIMIVMILKRALGHRRRTKPVIPKELKHEPVIPYYEAPDALPPIEVGTIYDREVDPTDVSSVIIDLAVRGYLKIRRVTTKVLFFKDEDFEITKLKDGTDLVTPADKEIFALLFSGIDTVRISDLVSQRTTVSQSVKKIRQDTLDYIESEGYFDKEAYERSRIFLKRKGWFVGIFGVIYILFEVMGRVAPWLVYIWFILFIFFGVYAGLLAIRLGRKLTPKGVQAMREILGFKLFLEVTEKDRLKMMSSPSAEPTLFEKNLPYAMVFGVEKEWAAKFDGIYAATPMWYEDPTATTFNIMLFTSQLGMFSTTINNSFVNTGYSSGSGNFSSGFGGGGFSGGGSGGGGGGSW